MKFAIKIESVHIGEDWNGKETADVSDIWKTATDSIETPPCLRRTITQRLPRSVEFVPHEPSVVVHDVVPSEQFLVVHAEEDNESAQERLNAVPDCKPASSFHII